jgi:hypothetical protein
MCMDVCEFCVFENWCKIGNKPPKTVLYYFSGFYIAAENSPILILIAIVICNSMGTGKNCS